MKFLIAIISFLTIASTSMAAQNSFNRILRAENRIQLFKEKTGHCFYNEKVYRTNVGWRSTEEIGKMSPRQRQFVKFKNNEVNSRRVFVAKQLCAKQARVQRF